jgi:hypothetical protein
MCKFTLHKVNNIIKIYMSNIYVKRALHITTTADVKYKELHHCKRNLITLKNNAFIQRYFRF